MSLFLAFKNKIMSDSFLLTLRKEIESLKVLKEVFGDKTIYQSIKRCNHISLSTFMQILEWLKMSEKNQKLKRSLYLGGIFGPVVFLLNDIIGTLITPGYNQIINAVSELTQAGAENAVLLSFLFLVAATGLVLFGFGLIFQYTFYTHRLIFLGGLFIILLGIFSALTGTIFPMDPFGEPATFAGEMHKYITLVNILLIVLAIPMIGIGIYKEKQSKPFVFYSVLTVILMISGGILTGIMMADGIEMLGLFERMTIYAYQLWVFILAGSMYFSYPQ